MLYVHVAVLVVRVGEWVRLSVSVRVRVKVRVKVRVRLRLRLSVMLQCVRACGDVHVCERERSGGVCARVL